VNNCASSVLGTIYCLLIGDVLNLGCVLLTNDCSCIK
jgi:hypothetical protein